MSVLIGVAMLLGLLTIASPAAAHDGTIALTLAVEDGRIVGTGLVAFEDVGLEDTSGDGLIDQSEIGAQQSALAENLVSIVKDNVELTVNGGAVEIIGAGLGADESVVASEYIGLAFATAEFGDEDVAQLEVVWQFTSPTNSVVVSQNDELVIGHLSDDGAVTFTLDGWATAASFFFQGIEHIRLGLDHALFLIVLALGVVGARVDRSTMWRVVKLVTAFTVGHAISLCLAYFEIFPVPAEIVEPAIALSIVAVAALAALGRLGKHPWWIAGVIGLVHGLGFASSLAGLGLATQNHIVALLMFNLGIDVAQLAVVAIVLAVYALLGWLLPRQLEYVRIAVCVAVGLVGLYWTVTRVLPV
ncbi:HupE/UreJ family protein [Microbacterium sp. NPDC076911]|uniref:HupE/UreJ family protein n=1 Tax=Microbacterium sp. NPDC076911 TaxID=3154958 RepID=UPI0034373305